MSRPPAYPQIQYRPPPFKFHLLASHLSIFLSPTRDPINCSSIKSPFSGKRSEWIDARYFPPLSWIERGEGDWVILQIDDITIPSCLVAPRGGIVFPFRKEFPLPKRLRFRESTRHISLSLSLFCLESRYSSRKKLKVQKWVWHRAMLRRHWYRWSFYRLSLQVKRPPDSKTFSIIDSVDFGRSERFIRCYSVEVGGRCCLGRVDSQFSWDLVWRCFYFFFYFLSFFYLCPSRHRVSSSKIVHFRRRRKA